MDIKTALVNSLKHHYRWKTPKGLLGVEALWDLSDEELDRTYRSIQSRLITPETSLFYSEDDEEMTRLREQAGILRFISEERKRERQEAREAAAKAAKKQQLLELLERKQAEKLSSLSEEELRKMIEEL